MTCGVRVLLCFAVSCSVFAIAETYVDQNKLQQLQLNDSVCRSVLQSAAVCCSALQCVYELWSQGLAMLCNELQCVCNCGNLYTWTGSRCSNL